MAYRTPPRRLLIGVGVALLAALVIALLVTQGGAFIRRPPGAVATTTGRGPVASEPYFLDVAVPWATVTLDGNVVHLPLLGSDTPLLVSGGQHRLAWRAAPFLSQHCRFSVPPINGDTCQLAAQPVSYGSAGSAAEVLLLGESLATLPGAQQVALSQAIQAALQDISTTVQPGESYFLLHAEQPPVATAPVLATLQFQVATAATTANVSQCQLHIESPVISLSACQISGQDCFQLCALPSMLLASHATATTAGDWLAFVVVQLGWNYTDQNGHVIATDQPTDTIAGGFGHLVLVGIHWDGARWSVRPLFGPDLGATIMADGVQLVDDPACLSLQNFLSQYFPHFAQVRFMSGANPSTGCLAEAALGTPGGTPTSMATTAMFLYRFGVVMAANDVAHNLVPPLQVTNAYEQMIVRQLAASPGQVLIPDGPLA